MKHNNHHGDLPGQLVFDAQGHVTKVTAEPAADAAEPSNDPIAAQLPAEVPDELQPTPSNDRFHLVELGQREDRTHTFDTYTELAKAALLAIRNRSKILAFYGRRLDIAVQRTCRVSISCPADSTDETVVIVDADGAT